MRSKTRLFGMRMTEMDVLIPANPISRITMRALLARSIGELDSGIRDARITYPDGQIGIHVPLVN
jgi:hypothetical protein